MVLLILLTRVLLPDWLSHSDISVIYNLENTDYDALAQKLLDTLSEQEKQFYKLKYIEHLPLSAIAEKLEISPTAAAKRSSRPFVWLAV